MKKITWLSLACCCVLFFQCSNSTQTEGGESGKTETPEEKTSYWNKENVAMLESVNDELKSNIAALATSYFGLKNSLVATDAATTASKSKEFEALLNAPSFASGSQPALDAIVNELKKNSSAISSSTDIAAQRTSFEELSHQMYRLVKASGSNTGQVYLQYCPMAFDFKGAGWLSSEQEIRNPYFGDKMLKCGEVLETIAAN